MKISLSWIKDYIAIDPDAANLAEKLTMAGIEVEGIAKFAVPEGVVVAEIKERRPHPNADKLSICKVWDGSIEHSVVCGARNCDAGSKVPLARLGATLTDRKTGEKLTIARREIRKIPSEGMLCSAEELGMDEKSDGLLHLPEDSVPGTALSELFPSDTVFDLEITPNRPDLLSHIGIARDLAAICGLDFSMPSAAIFAKAPPADNSQLVSVLAQELCPRYTARIVRGVKIGESPEWMKDRLRKIGLRPINNIVDITNYVLFETGQPLHAFDLSLLKGGRIVVRKAFRGEKIKTLDGTVHELDESNLVICDAEAPVALAGIMGGEGSGINDSTSDLLIESAYFEPSNIRASSRRLGISSDSSHRFERGVDIEGVTFASNRALSLILELAGGQVASELVDIRARGPVQTEIPCRFAKIKSLLGMDISNDEMAGIFKRLGCRIKDKDEEKCIVMPPSCRLDLFSEADLSEEVLRIHGISEIPIEPPRAVCGGLIEDDAYIEIEKFRNSLVEAGLSECLNYSFFDRDSALLDPRFGERTILPISNPLSKDSEYMRPSLLSGMLATVNRNISRGSSDLALFEMGAVFSKDGNVITEKLELCVAMSGRRHPERYSAEKSELYDFYDIKGLVESILDLNMLPGWKFEKLPDDSPASRIFTAQKLALRIGSEFLGIIGEAARPLVKNMRIKAPLYLAIFDMSAIFAIKKPKLQFKAFSQYPSTRRDIALEADSTLENSAIESFVARQKTPFLEKFEIFDVFSDGKIGKGRKSLAYSFHYRSMDKTLTDDEVNRIHDGLRAKIAKELPVQLR